ncbi:MAG TPA: hypothetical protein VFV50_18815 [Bdellovibrionales bacterium]|nr:hypothetical protein [Bdellovibrionales bacterium]
MTPARLWLVALALFTASCTSSKEPAYVAPDAKVLNMSGSAEEIQLPPELFDELMAVFEPQIQDKAVVDPAKETKGKLEVPTEFFAFHVFLREKTRGVLGGDNFELMYGKGGGVLDLKDFLKTSKGTFALGIRPILPEREQDEELKVFFLSNAHRREREGVTYGAGCDLYLDITRFFRTAMADEGLVVNVAGERHVGLVSGTLFFATSIKSRLYLSQLTVRDSRYKKLHCR